MRVLGCRWWARGSREYIHVTGSAKHASCDRVLNHTRRIADSTNGDLHCSGEDCQQQQQQQQQQQHQQQQQ